MNDDVIGNLLDSASSAAYDARKFHVRWMIFSVKLLFQTHPDWFVLTQAGPKAMFERAAGIALEEGERLYVHTLRAAAQAAEDCPELFVTPERCA